MIEATRNESGREGSRWHKLWVKLTLVVLALALAAGLGYAAVSYPTRVQPAVAHDGPASAASIADGRVTESLLSSPASFAADKLGPSVVNIKVSVASPTGGPSLPAGEGSGVIYSAAGFILTNNHVVTAGGRGQVDEVKVTLATGETLPATVVGTDPLTDLAVLKVVTKRPLPVATFANKAPKAGDYAIAIGSPFGYANSVTLGIVSGTGRTLMGASGPDAAAYVDLIQTDAAISPGNSGGALADGAGRVIGINVAYLPPGETGAENVGFAIPAETATRIADQLIKTGKASHVYLGVSTQTMTPELAREFGLSGSTSGALVAEVRPNSPASAAGIKQGDVITKVDDSDIASGSDILVALRAKQPGDAVDVTIERAGASRQVLRIVLQERPAEIVSSSSPGEVPERV